MAYNLELPGGLKPTNPTPADGYYNNGGIPYISVTEACTLVPRPVRYAGQTVLVGKVEYWWLGDNLADTGLVIKTAGANANGGSGGGIATTYANVLQVLAQNALVSGAVYQISGFPNCPNILYVEALDHSLFADTGYISDGGAGVVRVNVNVGYGTYSAVVVNAAGEATFDKDFTVSQSGGRTFGHFQDGDVVPATGKTAREVILLAAIDSKYPTYQPASVYLAQSAPADGEVGEAVNNALTASFAVNDAGALLNLRILRGGALLGAVGHASPTQATDSTVRVLGAVTYQASADYSAGAVKNVQPDNTPDPRPAQVRSPYARQAAENGYLSGPVNLSGYYRFFWGPVASNPASSAQVRALPGTRLTNAGNQFTLDTGATTNKFAIAFPANRSLQSVIDADALNADITSQYQVSTLNVNDAGGNPAPYKIALMTQAVPYSSSHRHIVTIG